MVDLIYGRGITDLIREMPFYINIFKKYASIKLFHAKPTMYGSVDIINVCNLHCTHCYWWLNRKNDNNDLSAEQWRQIINNTFKKEHIFVVTLVGGEPTLRPDVIKVFCEEMPRRVCVVTNGTYPLKRFEDVFVKETWRACNYYPKGGMEKMNFHRCRPPKCRAMARDN